MEYWWSGDRRTAAKYFRRALAIDPLHADAHNHLGIIDMEAGKFTAAEKHFRAAVEGGKREIEADGSEVPWGIVENRPYLRALGNLALVLADQKKWAEALSVHEEMLKLNPNDNQGVRYLVGAEQLRVGNSKEAIRAFEHCLHEEVGCAFGLALARLRADGPAADIGEPLIVGFSAIRYVAPMLLGERWDRLDAFHDTNMAEPEWANDVVEAQADLWKDIPRGAELLRFWWSAPAIVTWRNKLDAVMLELQRESQATRRSALVTEWTELRSARSVRKLLRAVRSAS